MAKISNKKPKHIRIDNIKIKYFEKGQLQCELDWTS